MGESRIRSGHVLLALADDADLKRLLARPVQDAIAVNVETLRENFHAIVAPSVEAREARGLGDAPGGTGAGGGAERKSGGVGKRVYVRVSPGGPRSLKQN